MTAIRQTVKVALGDTPMTYKVESWERPGSHHTVDLSELGGNGACTCTDFNVRCLSNLKKADGKWTHYGVPGKPNPKRSMCKHIFCARIKFTDDTLRGIAAQINPQPTA